MDLTAEQANGFVYACLGEDREKNGRYQSPIVVAYLTGALASGVPQACYAAVRKIDKVKAPGIRSAAFASFLEAVARVLRNPDDPVQVEDLVRCEACSITAHHDDAHAAGWVCGEDNWECPRCVAAEKEGQGAP